MGSSRLICDEEPGRHVQSPPILECAQVTGKAGENGQYSGEMGGRGVVTHSRPQ